MTLQNSVNQLMINKCNKAIKKCHTYDEVKEKAPHSIPGIYCFFLTNDQFPFPSLEKFYDKRICNNFSQNRPIYLGISQDLLARDCKTHFNGRSSKPTLRRTLGAILMDKSELDLSVQKSGKNKKFSHYSFDKDSEARLSEWMKKTLKFGYWENSDHSLNKELEPLLIRREKPLLNILFSPHIDAVPELRRLRKICAGLS